MPKLNLKRKDVPLRSLIKEQGIDTSFLNGRIEDQSITITSILNNTAVYYHTGKSDRKFVESLEKIMVNKSEVVYLPIRESTKPPKKTVS